MSPRFDTSPRQRLFIRSLMYVLLCLFVLGMFIFVSFLSDQSISGSVTTKILTTIAILVPVVLIIERSFVRGSWLPEAYSVAIVGYPQSGKTTLITSLFDEVWKGRVPQLSFRPYGESTIERLNKDLAKLKKGAALGPTTDQDKFAYTTNVRVPRLLRDRWLKVEFGDFPGEDSVEFAEQFGAWLHTTPFFKWAVTADAFVFCVDVAKIQRYDDPGGVLENVDYPAEISASIRAAWQHIMDYHEERARGVATRSVVLAFTKSDLLCSYGSKESISADVDKSPGSSAVLPRLAEVDMEAYARGKRATLEVFDDLIRYLNSECRRFEIIFVSSFGLQDGDRLGFAKLLRSVLP